MSEPEQDHDETESPFAFFRNSGEPPTEESRAVWAAVRDEAFPIPVVCGSKPPNWSMGVGVCESGCHTRVYVIDDANEEQYLVHDLPTFVAQASNLVDFDGNPNPAMEQVEIRRRIAALN